MNVTLSWTASILCITVIDKQLLANNYSLGIDFITNTNDSRLQNIAFERMKFMLSSIFNQSIFIAATNKVLPKITALSPSNLVTLPEEAYDQVINLAIYCKLNSVMEDILLIDSMTISNSVNDDITYRFTEGESLGPFNTNARKKIKPWWRRADLYTSDLTEGHCPINAWEEIGLGLNAPAVSKKLTKGKKIKHNTTLAKVDKGGFDPEIIVGGKHTDNE